jgi:hypothetical protein
LVSTPLALLVSSPINFKRHSPDLRRNLCALVRKTGFATHSAQPGDRFIPPVKFRHDWKRTDRQPQKPVDRREQAQRLLGCRVPARPTQQTLRRDDFSATKAALSFSEMLREFLRTTTPLPSREFFARRGKYRLAIAGAAR